MATMGQCRAIGCRQQLLPWGLFCDRHWHLIPTDIRKFIEKHHRNRQRPSKKCQYWIDQAVVELLELATTGKYRPRDGSFEWTDEPPAPAPETEKLPL